MFNYATWAFASTLALNRKYSVRAASRSQARRAQHRQARALTLPQLRRPHSFLTCPAPQKGESPPWQARFPLGGYASPLFPMAVMVSAAPSSRHKPRQPRVLANHMYVVGHSKAEPDENPSPEYRTRVFSGPSSSVPANSRFLAGATSTRRLRKLPLRVFAVPAPLRGMVFQSSEPNLIFPALGCFILSAGGRASVLDSSESPIAYMTPAFSIPSLVDFQRRQMFYCGHWGSTRLRLYTRGFKCIGVRRVNPLLIDCPNIFQPLEKLLRSAALRGRCLPSIGTCTTVSSNAWKSDHRRPTSVFFQPLDPSAAREAPPTAGQ